MSKYDRNFKDLHSFLQYAMRESKSRHKSSRMISKTDFCGGATWEEACHLATHGWYEGLWLVDQYRAEIYELMVKSIPVDSIVNDVSGYAVDIGAYLGNMPDCFYRRETKERTGGIIKLVVSVSFSWIVSTEVIIKRGAMICALADALELAGYRVEIIGNDTTKSYGKTSEINIVLKQADQPLNISSMAFCLAHPSMLRRILFSISEQTGWADFAYNYGVPIEATDQGDIYFGAIKAYRSPTIKEMAEEMINKMKELGVRLITSSTSGSQ